MNSIQEAHTLVLSATELSIQIQANKARITTVLSSFFCLLSLSFSLSEAGREVPMFAGCGF